MVAIRQLPYSLVMMAAALFLGASVARAETAPDALWSFAGKGHAGTTACVSHSTAQAASRFDEMIDRTARAFVVRPSFLRAVVACESNFNDQAESPAGARGLAQVMPQTARLLGVEPALLWDPGVNLYSAAKYIRYLVDRYGNDLDKVLIAYNAGPAYVGSDRPLPGETILYLERVKSAYRHFLTQTIRGQPRF
ncbi:MAG TPA: lytic transglycosylase domain-containing protein [Alphaproteobacteria bacterium]|nr:lytic transglycosylase domain-containing protein [Alphaproteobacteria bacterium]